MLSAARDGDDSILDWVESMLQFQNEFVVEYDQLIAITWGVKSGVLDVGNENVGHLMPHFGGVQSLKFSNRALKLRELDLMFVEDRCDLCLS